MGWTLAKSDDPSTNEDAFATGACGKGIYAVIADGQGGRPGGREAATVAVEFAGLLLQDALHRKHLRKFLAAVDQAVSSEKLAGFCALACVCIEDDQLTGVACGDCLGLLLGVAGAMELTSGQPKNPPVGSGNATGCIFHATLTAESRVLLATDGLWRVLRPDGLALWMREKKQLENLTSAYLKDRHDYVVDDATAVLIVPATKDA
ncbi:MAG: SpoIIE family protein phosphatase [Planctomycetota bacterium]|nr:SpoIIE family protein phosphatase [Planctomycetota bacterium]